MEEGEQFWNRERIILAGVFIAGLLIGAALMNQVVDPLILGNQAADYNALVELNERIDSRSDELYQCLVDNGIDADSC